MFRDTVPDLSILGIARSALIAASAAAFIVAIERMRREFSNPQDDNRIGWWLPGVVVAFAIGHVVLLALDVQLYSRLAREDGPVEYATAAIFVVCALFGLTIFRQRGEAPRLQRAGLGALMLAAVFAAGEEVSWGQRIFGFGTPEALSANNQGEFNLHNFATGPLELIIYGGAALLLIAGPWLLPRLTPLRTFSWLIPGPAAVLAAVPALAMTYELWNSLPIQWVWWLSLLLLLRAAASPNGAPPYPGLPRVVTAAMGLFLVVSTGVVLATGAGLTRMWDTSEWRELFIALAFLVWLVEIASWRADTDVTALPSASRGAGDPSA